MEKIPNQESNMATTEHLRNMVNMMSRSIGDYASLERLSIESDKFGKRRRAVQWMKEVTPFAYDHQHFLTFDHLWTSQQPLETAIIQLWKKIDRSHQYLYRQNRLILSFPYHFTSPCLTSPSSNSQVATGFRISSDARDSGIQIFDKFYALILSESDSEKLSQHSAKSTQVNKENLLLNCGLQKVLSEEYSEPDSQLNPNIVSYAAAVSIILGSKLHESNGELTLVGFVPITIRFLPPHSTISIFSQPTIDAIFLKKQRI